MGRKESNHTNKQISRWKTGWILISWLLRSQLIRIYTFSKTENLSLKYEGCKPTSSARSHHLMCLYLQKDLIREVEMGPFKHTLDDGLDIRKVSENICTLSLVAALFCALLIIFANSLDPDQDG